MKVVFLGTPRLAQIVLEKLIASLYKPALVITAPNTKAGRGQKFQESPVKQTAKAHKIPVNSQLSGVDQNTDFVILVAYGQLIPKEILEIPKYGFVNVHPSLLPKYRGPSPIQSVIFDGNKKTGISIIVLDEILDHGPILAKKEISIDENDTHARLIEKLGKIGADLLIESLPKYLNGSLKPQKQNHQNATYTKKITKADGKIDLANPPNAKTLDRMIRAFYPWPSTWCKFTVKGSQFTVKLLPNKMLQPEGKRPMTIAEFKNGFPELAGQIQIILNGKR